MRGAAVELARQCREFFSRRSFDGLLLTDMMNAAEFIALTRPLFDSVPTVLYMHESQISYPLHEDERVDYHYAITNFTSMLAVDRVVFNSEYHRSDFFRGIRSILNQMPDYTPPVDSIDALESESVVVPPGIHFSEVASPNRKNSGAPVILWNHRWDRDKRPNVFAEAVQQLHNDGVEFELIVCGERFREVPEAFESLKRNMPKRIRHFGYAETREDYRSLLAESDIVVSTAMQEFFGLSVVEAAAAGCFPLLPERLNYPHLIPEPHRDLALYQDGELAESLKQAIALADEGRLPSMSDHMKRYDWGNLIADYDALFE